MFALGFPLVQPAQASVSSEGRTGQSWSEQGQGLGLAPPHFQLSRTQVGVGWARETRGSPLLSYVGALG